MGVPVDERTARGAAAAVLDQLEGGAATRSSCTVVGVRREYVEAAFDEMRTRFGSLEGYFADGLGIDAGGPAAAEGDLRRGRREEVPVDY